jgi:6-phosphogluconate dehydrogenase
LIGEAVFARCLSSLKAERGRASKVLDGPKPHFSGDKKEFIDNLEQAVYASKIISYAQGFMLIQNVSLSTCFGQFSANDRCIGREGVQVEAQQAFDCSHVAWWLHHSISLLEGYHKSLPRQPRS